MFFWDNDRMRKLLVFILLLTLLTGYVFYNPFAQKALYRALYPSPCDYPISYTIKVVDPRFNLSNAELLSDLQQAGKIWSDSYGKQLFVYDPQNKSSVQVSLVYDARQALNNEIDTLKNNLNSEKSTIQPKILEYYRRSAEFKNKVNALNQQISYWNAQDGAPENEYQKLKAEQENLQKEASDLNTLAQTLNQSTDQFNAEVGKLNQTVDIFNQNLKVKPEEGLYNANKNAISIYFSTNRQELIHTLAHEFGHAIGLDHNSDQNSIMYPFTTQTIIPSTTDLAALQTVCQNKTIVEVLLDKVKLIYQAATNKEKAI